MDNEAMTIDVYLAWLVILALLVAFAVALIPPKPKKTKKQILSREGEAWMGRYIKVHKPHTTIHTIVNSMAGEAQPVKAMFSFIQREEFPDVSFYQGLIDWEKMVAKTRKVIIRAGQRNWVDTKFVINWIASRLFGLQRGCYWFYDGRESPGSQAKLLVSLIKDDKPELGVWIDWERNYGGSHEGIKNVVAMMQEVERLLPGVEVGMYTGYWFFRENSNPIWNAAQYAYLAKKKLWLAFYALLEKVLIPAPWLKMTYWQKGTPAKGLEYGTETIEIDMNEDMTGEAEPLPEPEPGESMQYKVTYLQGVTEREGFTTSSTWVRVHPTGTILNVVEVIERTSAERWGKLENGNYFAIEYNDIIRAEPVDPAPTPSPALPFKIDGFDLTLYATDGAGNKYKATVSQDGLGLEWVSA